MLHNNSSSTFEGLGISPRLLEILNGLNFTAPTPIQHKTIGPAIEGKDVIGIAQTGTGKTLAFGIPMIQRIGKFQARGLVLLPTRELALQVDETCRMVGKSLGLRTAVLIGGASMKPQIDAISRNPHVIIATPGRMIDHLEQKTLFLNDVSILVLDEADRMLDMGFAPQIKKILHHVPKDRQTMLFSATMPDDIVRMATQNMKTPFRVEIARPGTAAEQIEQELFIVKRDQKVALLSKLLLQYHGTVLIFSRTKYGARNITRAVQSMGHTAAEIHSNRSLVQRRSALDGFKSGRTRVLVATDIASRGIDVAGIELVINYDIPDNPGDYVHRIGRTGRAGQKGRAISFATPEQRSEVRDIERLMQSGIAISELPDLPSVPRVSVDRAPAFGARRMPRARGTSHRPYNNRSSSRGK
ncbi:MAG: DEAD/DEAH box helicase [bacterium]|nr:DEAD/DEAH box helicase [bacterium]